eukprot:COSAG01_NODE_31808_length_591_cov_0.735772_1_plen_57_part_01
MAQLRGKNWGQEAIRHEPYRTTVARLYDCWLLHCCLGAGGRACIPPHAKHPPSAPPP